MKEKRGPQPSEDDSMFVSRRQYDTVVNGLYSDLNELGERYLELRKRLERTEGAILNEGLGGFFGLKRLEEQDADFSQSGGEAKHNSRVSYEQARLHTAEWIWSASARNEDFHEHLRNALRVRLKLRKLYEEDDQRKK